MGAMSRLKVTCACAAPFCVATFCCAEPTWPRPLTSAATQAHGAQRRKFRGTTIIRDPKCSIRLPVLQSRLAVVRRWLLQWHPQAHALSEIFARGQNLHTDCRCVLDR